VKRGLEEELRMLAKVQYYYQEDEEYTFRQNDQQLVRTLTKDLVRNLDLVLELKLTNMKATETLQRAQTAASTADKFLAVPDPFKETLGEIYEQIFQSLQIDNADQIIKKILETVKAAQAQAQQSNNPQSTAKVLETMAFKDMASFPEAQVAFLLRAQLLTPELALTSLTRMGYTPDAAQAALAQLGFPVAASQPTQPGQPTNANAQNQNGPTALPGGANPPGHGNTSSPQNGQPGGAPAPGGQGAGSGQLPHGAVL
jgi:hypothetical protein